MYLGIAFLIFGMLILIWMFVEIMRKSAFWLDMEKLKPHLYCEPEQPASVQSTERTGYLQYVESRSRTNAGSTANSVNGISPSVVNAYRKRTTTKPQSRSIRNVRTH